jgi:hypothetical protein
MLVAGCANSTRNRPAEPGPLPTEAELGEALVNLPFDQQIAAGAILDRTIYQHHFAGDGVSLNALGERQIDALIDVATDQPITINVPNAGDNDELHDLRVAAVRERMLAAGVAEERLKVVDAPPGGPGILTEIIIQSIQRDQQTAGGTSGSGNRPTGTSGVSSSGRGSSAR